MCRGLCQTSSNVETARIILHPASCIMHPAYSLVIAKEVLPTAAIQGADYTRPTFPWIATVDKQPRDDKGNLSTFENLQS